MAMSIRQVDARSGVLTRRTIDPHALMSLIKGPLRLVSSLAVTRSLVTCILPTLLILPPLPLHFVIIVCDACVALQAAELSLKMQRTSPLSRLHSCAGMVVRFRFGAIGINEPEEFLWKGGL